MASTSYTGDGSTRAFNLNFEYLRPTDVFVKVNGVNQTFVWNSPTRVQLDAAPASGSRVTVYRDTDVSEPEVVFKDTQVLTEEDLNRAHAQHLYKAQEHDAELDDTLSRSLRFSHGQPTAEMDVGAFKGKFVTIDADGNPAPSDGTGADGNLRGDIAASTGASLIGTSFGKALSSLLTSTSMRPIRGVKKFAIDRLRAVDMAVEISDPATSPIWGFARVGGVTGGYGYTESITYDPDGDGVDAPTTVPFVRFVTNDSDDVAVEGSLRWAFAQIEANDGGYVIVHPRGNLELTLTSSLSIPNNCTFAAPGRNFRIRQGLGSGGIRFYSGTSPEYGRNIIMWGIKVLVEGGGSNYEYDQKPGELDALAAVPSYGSDRIALYECTISGATDGFFDIAGGATLSAPVYFSILNCVVRDTDKVMAIGVGSGVLGDPVYLYVTVGNCHFDGCSQRKPMASAQSFVHFVNNVDDALPHYRDYTEGSNIGSFACGDARSGGQLLYEGNIARFGTTPAGIAGTTHQGVADGGNGAAKLVGNYFEAGIINTVSFNEQYVEDLPAGYVYTPIDVVTDPEAAAKQIIEAAGAGRTNWPDGLYAPIQPATADALGISAYVNGEQVVYSDGLIWMRVDEETSGLNPKGAPAAAAPPTWGRTSTNVLAADTLDITNSTKGLFIVDGEGTAADNLATINGGTDGRVIYVRCSNGARPITVVNTGNINVPANIVLDHTGKVLPLIYDTATAKWGVMRW